MAHIQREQNDERTATAAAEAAATRSEAAGARVAAAGKGTGTAKITARHPDTAQDYARPGSRGSTEVTGGESRPDSGPRGQQRW